MGLSLCLNTDRSVFEFLLPNPELLSQCVPPGSRMAELIPEERNPFDGLTIRSNQLLGAVDDAIDYCRAHHLDVVMTDRIFIEIPWLKGYPPTATEETGFFRYADSPVDEWYKLSTMLTSHATISKWRGQGQTWELIEKKNCAELVYENTIPYGTIRIERKTRKSPALKFLKAIKKCLETTVTGDQDVEIAIA